MATTPLGIRYPAGNDGCNGPEQIQETATDVDTLLQPLILRQKGQVIAFGGIANVASSGTTEELSATIVALSGLTVAFNYLVHVHGKLSSSGTGLVGAFNVRAAVGVPTTASFAIPGTPTINPVTASEVPFSFDIVWEPTAAAMDLAFGVDSNNTQNCQLTGGYYIVTIG